MGDGVTGPGNAPANQAGRGAPSRSTDNGDKAKFDSALDQEKQSSRTHNGGKQAPAADKQVMDILDNPHLDENAKATELRKALADLPDSQKRELYERLRDRTSHDPLAQKFRDRLSHHSNKPGGASTKDQVLDALKPADSKSKAPTAAPVSDHTLNPDSTGLKPGERISARLTTKEDLHNPKAEMIFDFSKPITKDQAAAILFQNGKVPDGATLTQGSGNQWIVQYRNGWQTKHDVSTHLNSHTETVLTRSRLPGEMYYPEPNVTYSWVGGAKAFNNGNEPPPRRDLKNDMGFIITRRYRLDEGQSPEMNLRRLVQPGPGYEIVFDKPKTADQVKDTFFEKGVRNDQARVIPVGPEPAVIWQVQMLDGMTELKTPAAIALRDSTLYAKEAIAPGLPDGIKAHIQNQTVPADAKRFAPDVYVWEQDGHIVRVETNGKKGDAGYYKYEETKLHPTDQQGNNTMRWFMMDQGLPVRKAWQEYIKHWDEIHIGMLGMVAGAASFKPHYMGTGRGLRPAFEEPIGSRGPRVSGGDSGPSTRGVVSGQINGRDMPGGAPHAPAEPKVIVGRKAYEVGPTPADQTKALGMDPAKTKVVANASDGHGADFQVVSGQHPGGPAGAGAAKGGTAGTGGSGHPTPTTASKTVLLAERQQITSRLTQVQANIRSDADFVETFKNRVPSTEQGRTNLATAKQRLEASEAEEQRLETKLAQVDANLATMNGSIGELKVSQQTTRYRKGAVDVESWRPDVYLARDEAAHRRGAEKLMQAEPNGDLSRALLDRNGKLYPAHVAGQNLQYLRQHPEVWESSHALTRGEGKDVLVISSSYRNQVRGGQLERTGKVLSDRALVIQGMAIDPRTAWDLVAAGKLDASVVANAKSIELVR